MSNCRAWVFAVALMTGVFGCGDDGDSPVGGSSGAGGSAGAAGSAGTGGTAGAGGMAGTGGSAGMAGTGGAGGVADPCAPDPCMNGGVCSDVGGVASCDCAGTGYTGPTCATDDDECDGGIGPCDASGASACVNAPGTYMCTCNTGYEGMNCDSCASGFAMNEGVCVRECAPSAGLDVTLPTLAGAIGSYMDAANGFGVTSTPADSVFSSGNGLGVDGNASTWVQPTEILAFEFVENNDGALGGASSASNLSMDLVRNPGITAEFEAFDAMGAQIGATVTDTAGTGIVDISALFGGASIGRVTVTVQSGNLIVRALQYDHDCL